MLNWLKKLRLRKPSNQEIKEKHIKAISELVPKSEVAEISEGKKKQKKLKLSEVKFVLAANKSKRRDSVRAIVFHHICMGSFKQNVDFLASKEAGVSAHYVLGRNMMLY